MAHVAISALTLRPGGGLQVISGLAARFSNLNCYTILVSDPTSKEYFNRVAGDRDNISYVDPVGRNDLASVLAWNLFCQKCWLRRNRADCLLGVNHYFPSGGVPQIVYHMNVLRFDREKRPVWARGEIAERERDVRAAQALKYADANIFESRFLFETAKLNGRAIKNASIIYIGVDEKKTTSCQAPPVRKPSILAVTSAQPHKDNPTLIRMLSQLVRSRPDVPWRLKVAGGRSPGVFSDLQALAEEFRVSNQLQLLGFRSHEELAKLGRASLCLVSTSLKESFCMVGLEAMSWGCPVVVADTSAMPESVADAALLARPSDPVDFARCVLTLWEDRQLRTDLIAKGIKRAASLTWNSAAGQLEDVIKEVIDSRDRNK